MKNLLGATPLLRQKEIEGYLLWVEYRTLEIKISIARALIRLDVSERDAWRAADMVTYDGGKELITRLSEEGTTDKELRPIIIQLRELQKLTCRVDWEYILNKE